MLYCTSHGGNSEPLSVTVSELRMKMRDGVALYTRIMHLSEITHGPIVFSRNPYVNKDHAAQAACDENYAFLKAGYVLIEQHCRGCGLSEGDCIPYDFERNDGLDSLNQIRRLSVYDGEIYLQGASYLSSVHFSYLNTAPADIKGAVLAVQDVNRYNIIFRNGCLKVGLHGSWFVQMYKKNSMTKKNFANDSFRMFPLSKFSRTVFGEDVPAFDEPLQHPMQNDPFWQTTAGGADYLHALDNLQIPVLLTTSFFDIYTEGVFRMWNTLPKANRMNCAMLVSPYDHAFQQSAGHVVQFENGAPAEVCPNFALNWFESIRGKESLQFLSRGQITYYTVFGGRWTTVPRLEDGERTLVFYFNEHSLDLDPVAESVRTYLYNPFAPAPFSGGCCNNFGGMQVQDPPDSRYDILSFLSAPFTENVVLRGTSEVELHVKSDAPDTCFYVRMSLVRDCVAYGCRDDILPLSAQVSDYVPGTEAVLRFHFAEIALAVRKGDRIRLDVSSSCWPQFVPHTNRKGAFYTQSGADPAHNSVCLGKSCLIVHSTVDGK